MAFKARVHVQRPGATKSEYLGEIDLDQRPFTGQQITLTYKGRRVIGQIESVAPSNWEQSGVIPFVRVVLGWPEP